MGCVVGEQEQDQHVEIERSLFVVKAVALAVNGGWHLGCICSEALGTLVLQRQKGRDEPQLRERSVSVENPLGIQFDSTKPVLLRDLAFRP